MRKLVQHLVVPNLKRYRQRAIINSQINVLLGKMATIRKLLQSRQEKVIDTGNKVTVVGVGQVGMATVFSLLTQVSSFFFVCECALLLHFCVRNNLI